MVLHGPAVSCETTSGWPTPIWEARIERDYAKRRTDMIKTCHLLVVAAASLTLSVAAPAAAQGSSSTQHDKVGCAQTVGEATETPSTSRSQINAKGGSAASRADPSTPAAIRSRPRPRPEIRAGRQGVGHHRPFLRRGGSHVPGRRASRHHRAADVGDDARPDEGFSYAWRLVSDEGKQFTRLIKTWARRVSTTARPTSSMSR